MVAYMQAEVVAVDTAVYMDWPRVVAEGRVACSLFEGMDNVAVGGMAVVDKVVEGKTAEGKGKVAGGVVGVGGGAAVEGKAVGEVAAAEGKVVGGKAVGDVAVVEGKPVEGKAVGGVVAVAAVGIFDGKMVVPQTEVLAHYVDVVAVVLPD